MFFNVVIAIAAVFLLFSGLITRVTSGGIGTVMYFKGIPVVLGFLLGVHALRLFGLI